MRSIGEIMAEMGFNPESSTETQKAFFKHLVKAAEINQPQMQKPPEKTMTQTKSEPQQLEFNFGDSSAPKKVS